MAAANGAAAGDADAVRSTLSDKSPAKANSTLQQRATSDATSRPGADKAPAAVSQQQDVEQAAQDAGKENVGERDQGVGGSSTSQQAGEAAGGGPAKGVSSRIAAMRAAFEQK
jgi:hypothetical protein